MMGILILLSGELLKDSELLIEAYKTLKRDGHSSYGRLSFLGLARFVEPLEALLAHIEEEGGAIAEKAMIEQIGKRISELKEGVA